MASSHSIASAILLFLLALTIPSTSAEDVWTSLPAKPEVLFPNHKSLVSAAYAAIEYLHAQMDDDHSGSVDLDESRGFIQEELSQVGFGSLAFCAKYFFSNTCCLLAIERKA